MSNYKIHIDRPLPAPREIAKYRDFKRLHGQYRTSTRFRFWRDLYRKPKYFASLVMLIAVGYLVWEADLKGKDTAAADFASRIDVPYQEQALDTEQWMWESETGLKLQVAPAIFSGKQGMRLAFREIKNSKDMFIAGLDMRENSSEGAQPLLSTSLIELVAFRGEERLDFQDNISVKVSLLNAVSDTSLGIYYKDKKLDQWIYMGKDSVFPTWSEQDILKKLPPRPQAPQLREANGRDVDELRPKGVDASRPPAAKPEDLLRNYTQKLAQWKAKYEDKKRELEQNHSALRIFHVKKTGYYCLGKIQAPALKTQSLKWTALRKQMSGDIYLAQEGVNSLVKLPEMAQKRLIMPILDSSKLALWFQNEAGELQIIGDSALKSALQKGSLSAPKTNLLKPKDYAGFCKLLRFNP